MTEARPAPPDPTLDQIAAAWLTAVRAHRRDVRAFGRVQAAIVSVPDGEELHLTEETTFKQGDPLADAQAWLEARRVDREANGASGKLNLDSDAKGGRTTWAKVTETTVIHRPHP